MATVTAKSVAIARELADTFRKQVAATLPVVTESQDSDGFPLITLSADATPATAEKVVVIRVKTIDWTLAKDSLGNTAIHYGPHVIQICTEKNYEGASDTVLDILSPVELLPIIVECGRRGSFVEWYRSDNGTVPAVGQLVASKLAATWRDLYWNIQKAS